MIGTTRSDPRFAGHAAVAAFPAIGSYLGVPIVLSDGAFFGTLCAVDPEPRPFPRTQVDLMVVLARLVATQLERDREQAVHERLAGEVARAEALAESDRLKSALLAVVSHELRTPLTTIKTGVSSLLSLEVAWTEAEREAFLLEIDAELDRLALMVGNLLDLTRIEGGALRPRLAWHDPAELVAEAAARLAARAPDHPFTVAVEPGLPPVRCDRALVAQVLQNLGDNAAKYTPPGTPVTVAARRTSGAVEAVELEVSDRGPGIPVPAIDRVFEKFYRVEPDASPGGAGLGLAICKGLVEAHGGRIWAEGRAGGGTTVRFTLPLPSEGEESR